MQKTLIAKSLIAICAAAALAVGTLAVPRKAEAHIWWWIPAAIVGGAVVGGAVASSAYAQRGTVYVNPSPRACTIERERVPGGWREVEVCR